VAGTLPLTVAAESFQHPWHQKRSYIRPVTDLSTATPQLCGVGPEPRNRPNAEGVLFVVTMARPSLLLGFLACVALSSAAQAQDNKPAKAAPKQPTKAAAKDNPPFRDAIAKGDRAVVARDFEAAIAAYREAIQKDPQNALGHYRVGAAQLLKGDQKEAEAAFVAGLRFVGKDGTLKGKLLFALADLRERQKNNDEAIARWKEYAANAEAEKEAITYPATATERLTRNEGWKKLQAESAEVKARIEKRLKEADEASRKSAADPKNK
jgi:tetratricopeptide (TPR) repeat protein